MCTKGAAHRAEGRSAVELLLEPRTLNTAVLHFWTNDVVGNLQGQFDLVWATVAKYFSNDPRVVGYDPYNEPFSTETQTAAQSTFTGNLECFYTGRAHTGFLANGATPLVCPADVPDNGVVPSIQAVDHRHLIFTEPDIYWVNGGNIPSQLGPMPFQRIVFNFHDYCGDRSPVTGNPNNLLRCLQDEETAAAEQDVTRLSMSSRDQSNGPAIFMSEFGATQSVRSGGLRHRMGRAQYLWGGSTGPGSTTTTPPGRQKKIPARDGSYSPTIQVPVAHLPTGSDRRRQRRPFQPVHRQPSTMAYRPKRITP